MSPSIKKILIIGASAGLGEGFAHRFFEQGADIIITGRRQERLEAIKADLEKSSNKSKNTVETVQWDLTKLDQIPSMASKILKAHPDLDTVFVNAGIQKSFSWLDASTSSDEAIVTEINTNISAPFLLGRAFLPHLNALASKGTHAAFLITSSGLAFVPFPLFPVYNATKSAVHAMMVGLRLQVSFSPDENVKKYLSICEIIPPYVDTGLDAEHRDRINKMVGEGMPKPMALKEYLDGTMKGVNDTQDNGKLKWEVGVGFGQITSEKWREAFVPILESRGLQEV